MKYRFLVTCATGDIGEALCLHLARKGHDLLITARDEEKLVALSVKITDAFPDSKVTYYTADLGAPETMANLIQGAQEIGIDGVVLMPPRPPVLSDDPAHQFQLLNKAMQDCFTGPRYLLQCLLPSLEGSALKSVVLMSGASSKQPIANAEFEAFNDIRLLWTGCLKTFSDKYGPMGIRFNAISPGQVTTAKYTERLEVEAARNSRFFSDVLQDKTSSVPLKKFASVKCVVKAIYFLLKSTGASEITATNLVVDGGANRAYP